MKNRLYTSRESIHLPVRYVRLIFMIMIFFFLISSKTAHAQLVNDYIQNQASHYQQGNFWINGYARVGGADGTYKDYLKSYFKSGNAFSGLVLESNGSINMGINGAFAPNFRFRWLAHNNAAIDYSTTNDVIMQLLNDGTLLVKNKVVIGEVTSSVTNYRLNVIGSARANKMVVNTTGADYVFDPGYQLLPLDSLNNYIEAYHHLPHIPSASTMQTNGVNLGDAYTNLLAKVEELTKYLIIQDQKIKELESELKEKEK